MIVCVDVDYRTDEAVAACVGLASWADASATVESVTRTPGAPPPYESGAFFRRELPYVLAALAALAVAPRMIVVDGYAWLGPDRPGLGAHLHAALGGAVGVVGVAKRPFEGASSAIAVLRGASKVPLYVTAEGTDVAAAARAVHGMHGLHRIPTMLKRVDRLARAG